MEDNKFRFTYRALSKAEKQEIEDIRKDYLMPQEKKNKLNQIRELDNRVKKLPVVYSATICVVGILVFGLGLTCILEWKKFLLGVVVSALGSAIMGVAHLIYTKLQIYFAEKYKNRILTLSEELLNESDNREAIKDKEKNEN